MKYVIYKFNFLSAVHFGKKTLADTEFTFMADTLYSALCHEAVKQGNDILAKLNNYVFTNKLIFSDGMPYIGKELYVPKPMIRIQVENNGDSKLKKAYKKLTYIPIGKLNDYLCGKMNVFYERDRFNCELGNSISKTLVAIKGLEETKPYRVGLYRFEEGSGLYIILGFTDDEVRFFIEDLLIALSYSGLGGKRHSGYGRFELINSKVPSELLERIDKDGKMYMTLSISLPRENEIDSVIKDARYNLIKRSGFIASDTYADEQRRKKDLYMFASGSCVEKKFDGDVYDVDSGGKHKVYRYGKPIFMEVSANE